MLKPKIIISLLFVILSFSCAASSGDTSVQINNMNNIEGGIYCNDDEDCNFEQKCSNAHQCLSLSHPLEIPLGIEVYDQRSNSSMQGQLLFDVGPEDLSVDENGVINLVLPDSFHLSGEVKSEIPDSNINTMLIVYRNSSIPGKEIVSYSQNLGVTNEGGIQYDLELIEKGEYFIQVIPQPAQKASPIFKYMNLNEDKTVNFNLGEVNFIVKGVIQDEDGHPIKGASVWGFDLETGASSNVYETSTVEDSTGEFILNFTNIPTTLNIYVGPKENGSVIPSVLFKYSASQLTEDATEFEGINGFYAGAIALPSLSAPITFGTIIYGRTKSGNIENVSGALVTFKSEVGGGTDEDGIIVVQGVSNDEGKVTVELIPGSYETSQIYEATIKPPLDSPFASMKKNIEVGSVSGYGESIELEPKIAVIGQVLSPFGTPLGYTTIRVSPSTFTNYFTDNLTTGDYQPSTQSDADGWFSMSLDPGVYDFSIMFDTGKEYPNTVFSNKEVYQDFDKPFTFIPDEPALIKIKIVDSQGNPIENLEVRAYKLNNACPLSGICEYPPSLLSRSGTDADGSTFLIVPKY